MYTIYYILYYTARELLDFRNQVFVHTTDGGGAGGTFLGVQVAEAVEAVGKVITRGEALARQLLLTTSAQETVLMPGLVMVRHTASGDGLDREGRDLI